MAKAKLSAAGIKALTKPGRYSDGAGLFIRVSKGDSKSWSYRWKRTEGVGENRKPVVYEYGLGPFPAVSLAYAREKAAQCRSAVATGLHPRTVLDPPPAQTFQSAAREFMRLRDVKSQHKDNVSQWMHLVETRTASWSDRDIASIGLGDVLELLEPIWLATPEAARRARRRIEAVLDFATAREWRTGPNPARFKGNLEWHLESQGSRVKAHHPAMPYNDVPAFLNRLREYEGMGSKALQFKIYTVARTSEIRRARHEEFDLEARIWTRPPEHVKRWNTPHRIPLTDRAIEILEPLLATPIGPFVFAGQKPGKAISAATMQGQMDRMGINRADAVPHGFRSSFRDYIREQTSFSREIAELALAHKVGSSVEQAYARGDALERRTPLMELWAAYLEGAVRKNVFQFEVAQK
jgi:integrase